MPDQAFNDATPLSEQFGLAADAWGCALFALADQLKAGVSIKDATTGRYLHANQALAHCLRLAPERLLGRIDAELIGADAWVPLRAAEQFAATQSTPQTRLHRVDLGAEVCEFLVMRLLLPTRDAAAPPLLLSVWIDQTEQRQLERKLQQALHQLEQSAQALPDEAVRPAPGGHSGTALPLRSQFEEQLRRELDLSNREHREFSLVSVALDPFTSPLQACGELGRVRVQQAVTRLLRSNTRAMDGSFRIDDEHFAILLSGVGLATAHGRIEGLRRQCATEIIAVDGQDLHFTVAMGVASYPHTAQDRETLLAAAHAALAQAQQRGGNHVALASIRFERR